MIRCVIEGGQNLTLLICQFLPRDAMLARCMQSSCVSVYQSVYVWVCVCHTQTTPRDSSGTLAFFTPRVSTIFQRSHPNGGDKCRWDRLKYATFDK